MRKADGCGGWWLSEKVSSSYSRKIHNKLYLEGIETYLVYLTLLMQLLSGLMSDGPEKSQIEQLLTVGGSRFNCFCVELKQKNVVILHRRGEGHECGKAVAGNRENKQITQRKGIPQGKQGQMREVLSYML